LEARQLVGANLTAAGLRVLDAPLTVEVQTPPVAVVYPAEFADRLTTACGHSAWLVRVELIAGDPTGAAVPSQVTDVADGLFNTCWPALRPVATLHSSTVDVVAGRWLARTLTVEVLA
jgi:hypothetical protein